jgi:hypothetical protein
MRAYARVLLTLSFLLIPFGMWGQKAEQSEKPDLLARLSCETSVVTQRDGVRQVCLAVSRDREYRIVRLENNGQTQRLHGTLTTEQFEQLTKFLDSPKFRTLSGNHGGLIRQDAESFAAEIPLGDRWRADGTGKWLESEARRLQWLNADGESPFPDSVAKIVDWLQQFEPKNGKEFEYTEFPNVCPSGGLRLVQPAVADNQRP